MYFTSWLENNFCRASEKCRLSMSALLRICNQTSCIHHEHNRPEHQIYAERQNTVDGVMWLKFHIHTAQFHCNAVSTTNARRIEDVFNA